MLKKSRMVAVLSVCIMMFAVVQPAFAWWGEDTLYGAYKLGTRGGFWGATIGAVAGAVCVGAMIATCGLAGVPLMGAASLATAVGMGTGIGAAGGAVVVGGTGAAVGAMIGLVDGKEAIDREFTVEEKKEAVKEVAKGVAKGIIIGLITGQFTESNTK